MLLQILVLYGLEDSRCCATLRETVNFQKVVKQREKKTQRLSTRAKTITILHHQLVTPIKTRKISSDL